MRLDTDIFLATDGFVLAGRTCSRITCLPDATGGCRKRMERGRIAVSDFSDIIVAVIIGAAGYLILILRIQKRYRAFHRQIGDRKHRPGITCLRNLQICPTVRIVYIGGRQTIVFRMGGNI